MIRTLLAFFGYVRVPFAVVQLSVEQENFLLECHKNETDPHGQLLFSEYYRGQRALTEFLKSGLFLNNKENYGKDHQNK
jgi:hypothetical protein